MNLYFIDIKNFKDDIDYKKITWLKEDDIKKINDFKKSNDKKLSLASLFLQYYLINEKLSLNFEDIFIKKNKYGKPYYDNLNFNVSHDKNLCCLISNDNPIGIDIVNTERQIDKLLYSYIFTKKEIDRIENKIDFFKLWSLKESYLKAIGTGFNFNLKRIEFLIERDVIKFYLDGLIQNDWIFKIIMIDNYLISISTTAGFEPARAWPNGFQVHLLNHSDTLSDYLKYNI